MPRKPGPQSEAISTALAVRVSKDLAAVVLARCGGLPNRAEWLRNVLRHACKVPLDYKAGYEEGKMQGWADAGARFREAMKGSRA